MSTRPNVVIMVGNSAVLMSAGGGWGTSGLPLSSWPSPPASSICHAVGSAQPCAKQASQHGTTRATRSEDSEQDLGPSERQERGKCRTPCISEESSQHTQRRFLSPLFPPAPPERQRSSSSERTRLSLSLYSLTRARVCAAGSSRLAPGRALLLPLLWWSCCRRAVSCALVLEQLEQLADRPAAAAEAQQHSSTLRAALRATRETGSEAGQAAAEREQAQRSAIGLAGWLV